MSATKLNTRQEAFCQYYAKPTSETYGNASESYLRAGYAQNDVARKNAYILKTKKDIKKRIAQINKEFKEENAVTEGEMADYYLGMRDRLKTKDPVNSLRAAENLSKHIGFYKTDNEQQTGHVEDSPKPADAVKRSKERIKLANAG